eukprot:8609691-Alexandrium_andersonii.AAC.1
MTSPAFHRMASGPSSGSLSVSLLRRGFQVALPPPPSCRRVLQGGVGGGLDDLLDPQAVDGVCRVAHVA